MQIILSSEIIQVNGKEIVKIYGGFDSRQPTILTKQIADIHSCKLKEINRIISNHQDWFDEGVDYIDLKANAEVSGVNLFLRNFYTQGGINRSSNIFLLSQQGYALLCKFLKSDLAKQTYKQMIREYFAITESIRQAEESLGAMANQLSANAQQLVSQAEILKATIAEIYRNKADIGKNRHDITQNRENIEGLDQRVSHLEGKDTKVSSFINQKQIETLKIKVKEKGNPISIWKKFNKAFGISRYKFLESYKFEEAIAWVDRL